MPRTDPLLLLALLLSLLLALLLSLLLFLPDEDAGAHDVVVMVKMLSFRESFSFRRRKPLHGEKMLLRRLRQQPRVRVQSQRQGIRVRRIRCVRWLERLLGHMR